MDVTSSFGHTLLKLDSRGRVLIPSERRTGLLEEFDRSGMTGAGFARHYGIKYTTFAHWIRMRKRANRTAKSDQDKKFLLVTGETLITFRDQLANPGTHPESLGRGQRADTPYCFLNHRIGKPLGVKRHGGKRDAYDLSTRNAAKETELSKGYSQSNLWIPTG